MDSDSSEHSSRPFIDHFYRLRRRRGKGRRSLKKRAVFHFVVALRELLFQFIRLARFSIGFRFETFFRLLLFERYQPLQKADGIRYIILSPLGEAIESRELLKPRLSPIVFDEP